MQLPTRHRWKFLTQGVSIRTVLRAMIPVCAWIVFLVLFVSAYRAVVHVSGPVGTALRVVRGLIELGTVVIALKYFFEILERGAADDFSAHPQDRT